jgi:phthalate 4,5-dioxygenase
VEKGTVPPGVDPEHQKVRSAAVVLPRDKPYKEAAKEHLRVRTGAVHASV